MLLDLNNLETETLVKQETPKERFYKIFTGLKSLTEEQKTFILEWLEEYGFFNAPAAASFHSNYVGGLCVHSLNVMDELCKLTASNNIHWYNSEEPIIIGLMHDLCKVQFYEAYERQDKINGKWGPVQAFRIKDKSVLTSLGNHGDRSMVIFMSLLMLKDPFKSPALMELLSGIRFHMGFSQDGDLRAYSNAMGVNSTLPWVNLADTLAADKETKLEEAKKK